MENTIHFYVPHTYFRVVSAISSHFGALKVVKMAILGLGLPQFYKYRPAFGVFE